MSETPRIALLHTGAVVIGPIMELVKRELPGITAINYLDDRIVADLGDPDVSDSVPRRVAGLAKAAADAGAEAIMLTCSSISELAAPISAELGIPILRIDEAMADQAVATGSRITVLATLPTTCGPTSRLIAERARAAGLTPAIRSVVVEGAFAAVASGDRPGHDRIVADAIRVAAEDSDVVVLAQASMASAAEGCDAAVPVLTSLESGVQRLHQLLASLPAKR